MPDASHLTHVTTLCGQCSCGCPELYVDPDATPERRILITDDFGQRVQMSVEQLQVLVDQARAGVFDQVLSGAST